ncbi:MAG TPA: hypothetical protein GX702_13600 [Chloroflexi bacterium]|jgi:hypothetical protein|nr:hypothetical protein [Chloroflexota bacterium]
MKLGPVERCLLRLWAGLERENRRLLALLRAGHTLFEAEATLERMAKGASPGENAGKALRPDDGAQG